ncbi:MAG: OmpA family protein [Limisphaerales bacterium]|jgi:peptidoglycan-associated lipoprotein
MKLIKLSLVLALVAVVAVTATGCKKGPKNTTPLPGQRPGAVGGERPTGTDTVPVWNPDQNPLGAGGSGMIPLSDWDVSQFDQDRAALAAHTVYFAFDSDVVRSSEQSKVAAVASALQTDGSVRLLIEGHCDERGTEEYNRALGERRALSLRAELAKQGVDPQRIKTISYGEDRPAVLGHNEAAWAKNRRGEFILLRPKM